MELGHWETFLLLRLMFLVLSMWRQTRKQENQNWGRTRQSNSPLCSVCKEEDEIVFHLYFYCPNVRNLWNQLKFILHKIWCFHPKHWWLLFLSFPRKAIPKNVILYNLLFIIFNFTFFVLGKRTFECYELGKSDNTDEKNWKRKLTLFWKKAP